MADLSVFGRIKTKQDFDREAQDFAMKKALANAELKKASQLDIDQMGEQAFYKAAQGLELTPQERAAAAVVDAKSGGLMYNPVTGQATQKPRLSDKIGIDGLNPPPAPTMGINPYANGGNQATIKGYEDIIPTLSENDLNIGGTNNEYDAAYQAAMRQAADNPKLQQTLTTEYLKGKTEYNVEQGKNAGFAERITNSIPTIKSQGAEGTSLYNKVVKDLPLIGNKMVNENYQLYDQAKRDIINAILRRESGAVISPEEFANAEKQYFPQYGDTEKTIAQKNKNLETTLAGIERAAGSAYQSKYTPNAPQVNTNSTALNMPTNLDKASEAESIFNAKKAIKNGADADMVRQRLMNAGIDPSKAGL